MKETLEIQRGRTRTVAAINIRKRGKERGSSRLQFLVTMLVLALIAYSAYQYVPVAIHAYQYKDFMQQTVDKAVLGQGRSGDWVKTQLKANAIDYDVPPDAAITTEQRDGRLEARVQFTRAIPLPGYVYQFNFDHTVRSTQLFSTQ